MHSGTHYSFREVLFWTRRDIFALLFISTVPTFLYIVLGWKWLAIPWLPVALLGTAVAFMVGFKNNASYDRVWEARKVWGSIVNTSRGWGVLVRDYVTDAHAPEPVDAATLRDIHLKLYTRHFAWLTALRYQLREPRPWEAIYKQYNKDYKNKWFAVEEQSTSMADALKPYLSKAEYQSVLSKTNKATQILALQSEHLKHLRTYGLIDDFRHVELEKLVLELYNQQGASERIKNFPYPRQYATMNMWFTKIFILLLPLGMLQEFEKFEQLSPWVAIPFSALCCWIFTTMDKIGESTESPFEGSANDVPITAMSRGIEIDLREMLDEAHDLKPITAQHNILL